MRFHNNFACFAVNQARKKVAIILMCLKIRIRSQFVVLHFIVSDWLTVHAGKAHLV